MKAAKIRPDLSQKGDNPVGKSFTHPTFFSQPKFVYLVKVHFIFPRDFLNFLLFAISCISLCLSF